MTSSSSLVLSPTTDCNHVTVSCPRDHVTPSSTDQRADDVIIASLRQSQQTEINKSVRNWKWSDTAIPADGADRSAPTDEHFRSLQTDDVVENSDNPEVISAVVPTARCRSAEVTSSCRCSKELLEKVMSQNVRLKKTLREVLSHRGLTASQYLVRAGRQTVRNGNISAGPDDC